MMRRMDVPARAEISSPAPVSSMTCHVIGVGHGAKQVAQLGGIKKSNVNGFLRSGRLSVIVATRWTTR